MLFVPSSAILESFICTFKIEIMSCGWVTKYKEQIISESGWFGANVLALKHLPVPSSGSYKCEYNRHNQDHPSVIHKQKKIALDYRKQCVKPSGWNLCVYEYKWW